MQYKKTTAILLAVLAAAFLRGKRSGFEAAAEGDQPYISGITAVFRCRHRHRTAVLHQPQKATATRKNLTRKDLPYTLGMILLDFAAPILLMLGLKSASSANASLLGKFFEIVATTLIALLLFREKGFQAAVGCHSADYPVQRHFVFRGYVQPALFQRFPAGADGGSLLGTGEQLHPQYFRQKYFRDRLSQGHLFRTGFVSHCSVHRRAVPRTAHCCCGTASGICCLRAEYFAAIVRSQNTLGAAKTSAYYAIAPFIGTALSCIIWHDALKQCSIFWHWR